jgi:muramoyltetrapeptide carboxypeptidase
MAGRAFTIGVVATAARIAPGVVDLINDIVASRYGREVAVRFHPDSFVGHGHFSAQDEVRASALIEYASASEIDAIWFGRGGYGSVRILPSVLPVLVRAALQKPYLGYSDLGGLLAALYANGGRNIAHGPMAHDVTRINGEAAAERALGWLVEQSAAALESSIDAGRPTIAFNLTVLTHLVGTPWEPKLAGHVVQIEEVSEHLYRIDRSFGHLAQTAIFRDAAGIRLGRCNNIIPNQPDFGMTPEDIARHWCSVAGVPFLGSADIGHDADNKVVPFGSRGLRG